MRIDANSGHWGWLVIDKGTGSGVDDVLWLDTGTLEYCTADRPLRVVGNEIVSTVRVAQEIIVDIQAMTFWITKAPVTVAPLSPGRQQEPENTGKPCPDCRQPEARKRTGWCAAHRCGFGSVAP